MKRASVLLAVLAFFFAGMALAGAIVTSAVGTVQGQVGSSASRMLRVGDEVNQGTTVSTGPASSVVLKFDDGQVAALTANSRMVVTAYQYSPSSGTGNILLSLLDGGMRAITGLIGKNSPDRVSYRAATATIGIRGTDVTIVTAQGNVIVSVTDGAVSFTFREQTVVISAGQAIHLRPDGTFSRGSINQISAALQGTPLGQSILAALGGLAGLTEAINAASPGTPRPGQGPPDGLPPGPPGTTPGPGGPPGGGAGGGGTGSPS
jgi:hypothetical protein